MATVIIRPTWAFKTLGKHLLPPKVPREAGLLDSGGPVSSTAPFHPLSRARGRRRSMHWWRKTALDCICAVQAL